MSGRQVTRPPPCAAHIVTKFDPSRAVYFGGRRETGYTNEAWILELDRKVCNIHYQVLSLNRGGSALSSTLIPAALLPVNIIIVCCVLLPIKLCG